jgi:hypothetical protein
MRRLLTEQKVLRKLDIEDFRHLTKDKVITPHIFTTMVGSRVEKFLNE